MSLITVLCGVILLTVGISAIAVAVEVLFTPSKKFNLWKDSSSMSIDIRTDEILIEESKNENSCVITQRTQSYLLT